MRDLSALLTAHAFPTALPHVRRSFARQPDFQTCGAAAVRHGLLLGGLTVPASALEAVLGIRANQGTPPDNLRECLNRLGLQADVVRKRPRQSTAAFLRRLRSEFEHGAFVLPCIRGAEHWVCLGEWRDGKAAVVDSFFGRLMPAAPRCHRPELGFFSLAPEQLDALDWNHFVTLVRPGVWREQYRAWLPAREELLRLKVRHAVMGRGSKVEGTARNDKRIKRETTGKRATNLTAVQELRRGVHQYLDDADYSYQRIYLQLRGGSSVNVCSADPGADGVGVETLGRGREEIVVVRRLGGVLSTAPPPELVVRASHLGASYLAE